MKTTEYAIIALPGCLAALYGVARISVPNRTDTGATPPDRATLIYTDGAEETATIPHVMAESVRVAATLGGESPGVESLISAVQSRRVRDTTVTRGHLPAVFRNIPELPTT